MDLQESISRTFNGLILDGVSSITHLQLVNNALHLFPSLTARILLYTLFIR